MTKFKMLDHPVDEEEYLDFLDSYIRYLQEALAAGDRGENIDDVVSEIEKRWKMAGILDDNGVVVPRYAAALNFVRSYSQ